MKKHIIFFLTVVFFLSNKAFAQEIRTDKGEFLQAKTGYFTKVIQPAVNAYRKKNNQPTETKKYFKVNFDNENYPANVDLYTRHWHNKPVSQGNSNTCWSFSTISFYESEVFRLTKQQVKLSELFIVYYEYIEKVKYYVETRGESFFTEGSEANAVTRMMKKYGIVPYEVYSGMLKGQEFIDHQLLFDELGKFLLSVKKDNVWNEEFVIATTKSILNNYMGTPPTSFKLNGKEYTPEKYLKEILKLNMDDYVDILSYMQEPYYTKTIYSVPDNWWHSYDYYNVPLNDFMNALKSALKNGFTVAIGGDISEPGFVSPKQVAIIPTFDIPSQYIDENARQFRFSNETTTDDHGMHIVGYYEKDGIIWFLVKDSGSGSRTEENNSSFGYYFFHEDYVKLKMMDFTVHKDAVKELLEKCKK